MVKLIHLPSTPKTFASQREPVDHLAASQNLLGLGKRRLANIGGGDPNLPLTSIAASFKDDSEPRTERHPPTPSHKHGSWERTPSQRF